MRCLLLRRKKKIIFYLFMKRLRGEKEKKALLITTQVFMNAGARLLCTSDGVCVIVYVEFSSVAGPVWGGEVFSSFWD